MSQFAPASPGNTPTAERVPTSRLLTALTWGCVLAGLAMLAVLSQRVERTPDEVNYLLAGRTLVARQPLEMVEQRFQGPLILLGTQLTSSASEDATAPETLHRARLGMLVFPALLLTVLVLWSRAALGPRAALLISFLAATNPTMLAYGPLLSSDVAFTATSLTAAWLLWRWLRSSRVRDLLVAGAALGAVVATKYAGLLTSAIAVPVVVLAVWLGFDPMPPRFGTGPRSLAKRASLAAVALVIAGAVAIATLHCCYLFASPSFAPSAATSLSSGALRAIAALPLGPQLLGLLPEPLVLGIDYQTSVGSQQANGTFLDRVGNHWAYYPVSLLTKTPLATLGLSALGSAALLQAWRRRSAMEPRFFWSCALIPPLTLLVYLSATRALQMGVRYVMPMVPALLLLAGAWLRHPWAITKPGRGVTALAVASSVFVAAAGWPHYIGYFNAIAGGSEGGYKICADGNCDWMQRHGSGQEALRSRHPPVTCLRIHEGPRFGLVAAYTEDLKSRDPEDPTRTYHWLTRFTPIDHDGAAWLVFDVTPAAFEALIAAGDRRAANDLAVAWLRERDFVRARAALAMLPARTEKEEQSTRQVRELIDLMEAVEQGDEAQRNTAVDRLSSAGHPDLALSLLTKTQRGEAIRVFLLTWATGRGAEAIETLEQKGADGSRTAEEVYWLATAMHEGARDFMADPVRAQRLMELGPAPAPGSPLEKPWEELRQKVRRTALWFRQVAK
ncbi:MAG TPA: phospholipid carrier-dependent glycosyltransferase [Planctomycetota bacterium]|nr:phospholipid carrier-dependent glycosyltransferase [Planctomycetota bacterium]